jgi:arylsulfatase A-like enzyme
MGKLDNTLFIYIFGDNGSSAEGGLTGTFNETTALNGIPVSVEEQLGDMDEWSGPASYPHFQAGWAVATNTPFQWTKQYFEMFGNRAIYHVGWNRSH